MDANSNRRRINIIAVILATIPCYCIGWLAWTVTPPKVTATPTATISLVNTATPQGTPTPLNGSTNTPNWLTATFTFTPSVTLPSSPTSSVTPAPSWTPFLPPTLTYTPSWTPIPPSATYTSSPVPPSNTPIPPSNTPVPPTATFTPSTGTAYSRTSHQCSDHIHPVNQD